MIVDCAQALFAKPIDGVKTFYSTRKYVGVADGGVAYLGDVDDGRVKVAGVECTVDHDKHLFTRKQFGAEAGFAEYQENETKLDDQPIRWMSDTTKRILDHIDFERVIVKRRSNFAYLHEVLKERNFLQLPNMDTFSCPMVYPFVTRINRNLRKELIDNKVFVARYWPNVRKNWNYDREYYLATGMEPLPIDHRYGEEDMETIIDIIIQ